MDNLIQAILCSVGQYLNRHDNWDIFMESQSCLITYQRDAQGGSYRKER